MVYLAYSHKTRIWYFYIRIFGTPNPHITRILGKVYPHNTRILANSDLRQTVATLPKGLKGGLGFHNRVSFSI